MSRYIDADAMMREIAKSQMNFNNSCRKCKLEWVKSQPTADVVEVKHGKWHKFSENDYGVIDGYYCSECGYRFSFPSYVIDEDDEDVHLQDCLYCEHCGAKMDGETE